MSAARRYGQLAPLDLVLIALGALLALDLVFAPWFSIGSYTFAFHLPAVKAPDGAYGIAGAVAGGALAIAVLIDCATTLPIRALSALVSVAALVCVVLKFAVPPAHTLSLFGYGFWGAALLVVAMVGLSLVPRPRS